MNGLMNFIGQKQPQNMVGAPGELMGFPQGQGSMFTGSSPFTGDWPPQQPQGQFQQQQPSFMGNNASVMQLLQSMMNQPGGNPFGAPTMGDLPTFGTPWAGGMPQGLPDIGPMPSASSAGSMGGGFQPDPSMTPFMPKMYQEK